MCRWLAYSGVPIHLEALIFKPEHSLIDQSLQARRTATTTNGDGFGMGWYGDRSCPGVYKGDSPAWNDQNLRNLAAQVASPMFLAHVRASTETAIQRSNCHPFSYGNWLFVHNGKINGYRQVRRDLALAIDPDLYPFIEGTTDSELMFLLALTFGLQEDAVPALERMVGFVEETARSKGIQDAMQMSLGLADGQRLIGVRYASNGQANTLFHSRDIQAIRAFNPDLLPAVLNGARTIVSEPLTELDIYWEEIPESTAIVVDGPTIEKTPFQPRPPG